ncbi:uncharacterized protein LOC129598532 [Paramacrobiotus metropolitanus]|uniref:uncharacterized protein LOC129598532 n=1 Tax=Paramacrobiotus metropolitanus TaxID=2943436 RepID=UPI0024455FC0|nr:uncharacterized protein LOC129598532 [Paramacrobiotus metropolitanus]XP_055352472.1 uncharacterized protein LOC129598532 [Paramacrobiotus metropolitanus]
MLSVNSDSKAGGKGKRGVLDDITGLGKKSAQNILKLLPADEHLKQVDPLLKRPVIMCPVLRRIASSLDVSVAAFVDYLKVLRYHMLPIPNTRTKQILVGAALFPSIPHRAMKPVCWDINVTFDYTGRRLFVRATEDIAMYTGLSDLRYCELMQNQYQTVAPRRRQLFRNVYGYLCICRKCTPEYEAELNPLKCSTMGCTERIPSDDRACSPCPQCGAVNYDRRNKLMVFLEKCAARFPNQIQYFLTMTALFDELEAADLVHPDAHVRFVCGLGKVAIYNEQHRFKDAWKLAQELMVCVRNICPKYHVNRATFLADAVGCPLRCTEVIMGKQVDFLTPAEKIRLVILFEAMFPSTREVWRGYCEEAMDTFTKLSGPDCYQAVRSRAFLATMDVQQEE